VSVIRYSCVVRDKYLVDDSSLDSLKRQIDVLLDQPGK
jgi:hypothetical protein